MTATMRQEVRDEVAAAVTTMNARWSWVGAVATFLGDGALVTFVKSDGSLAGIIVHDRGDAVVIDGEVRDEVDEVAAEIDAAVNAYAFV